MNVSDDRWVAGDAYEAYMGRWSRLLARAFVEWLHPAPAATWLEVGCGTGALTSTICELCAPASVVACDPSEPFVAHARKHLPDAAASFVVTGAEALPGEAGGFDAVVSGLVLNFLRDPGQALAAMRERLRPGGTVAAYVWARLPSMKAGAFRSAAHRRWPRSFNPPGWPRLQPTPWTFRSRSPASTTAGLFFSAARDPPPATSRPWIRRAGRR